MEAGKDLPVFGSPEVLVGEGTYQSGMSYTTPRPPRKSKQPPNTPNSASSLTPNSCLFDNSFTNSPLNKQLTCARESNRGLKDRLGVAEEENNRLLSTITVLESEVEGLKKLEGDLRKRLRSLENDKVDMLRRAKEATESPTKQRLHDRVQSLKRDTLNKDDELNCVKRELNGTVDKMVSLEKQVISFCEKLKLSEKQVGVLNQRMADAEDDHESEIRRYTQELDRQRAETSKWRDTADEYQSSYERSITLERENRALCEEAVVLEQRLTDKVDSLTNARDTAVDASKHLKTRNSILETKCSDLSSVMEQMKRESVATEVELRQALDTELKQNVQIRQSLEESRSQISGFERKILELELQTKTDKAQYDEALFELGKSHEHAVLNLEMRIQQLQAQIEAQATKHKDKVSALKTELSEIGIERNALLGELAEKEHEYERANESFGENVQSLKEGLTLAHEELETLTEQLRESESQSHQLSNAHKKALQELNQLQAHYDHTLTELESSKEMERNLSFDLKQVGEEVRKLNGKLEAYAQTEAELKLKVQQVEASLKASISSVQDENEKRLSVQNKLEDVENSLSAESAKVVKLEAAIVTFTSQKLSLDKKLKEQGSVLADWDVKWVDRNEEVTELEEQIDHLNDKMEGVLEKEKALQKVLDNTKLSLLQESNARETIERRLADTRHSFVERLSQMSRTHADDEARLKLQHEEEIGQLVSEQMENVAQLEVQREETVFSMTNIIDNLNREKQDADVRLEAALAELDALRQLDSAINENALIGHIRPGSSLSISHRDRRLSNASGMTDSLSMNTVFLSNAAAPPCDNEDDILEQGSLAHHDTDTVQMPAVEKYLDKEVMVPLRSPSCSTPDSSFKKPFTPLRPQSARIYASGDYMGQSHTLPRDRDTDWGRRLSEINGQNSLYLPHLRSSNPIETQELNLTNKDDDSLKHGQFTFDDKMVSKHKYGKPKDTVHGKNTNNDSIVAKGVSYTCMHIREKMKMSPAVAKVKRIMHVKSPSSLKKKDKENADPAFVRKAESFQISPPRKVKKKLLKAQDSK